MKYKKLLEGFKKPTKQLLKDLAQYSIEEFSYTLPTPNWDDPEYETYKLKREIRDIMRDMRKHITIDGQHPAVLFDNGLEGLILKFKNFTMRLLFLEAENLKIFIEDKYWNELPWGSELTHEHLKEMIDSWIEQRGA